MNPPTSVHRAINEQIKNELQAHYNYLGMSAHFEDSPYPGFAQWMRLQSLEEHGHAMKLFDFLRERNVTIELSALEAPRTQYDPHPLGVFETALAQEQGVTRQIFHPAIPNMVFAGAGGGGKRRLGHHRPSPPRR